MNKEIVKAVVDIKVEWDTKNARAQAIREIRESLWVCVHSVGIEGSYSVELKKVHIPKVMA